MAFFGRKPNTSAAAGHTSRRALVGLLLALAVSLFAVFAASDDAAAQGDPVPATTTTVPAGSVWGTAVGSVSNPGGTPLCDGLDCLPAWRWDNVSVDARTGGWFGSFKTIPHAFASFLFGFANLLWRLLLGLLQFALTLDFLNGAAAKAINVGAATMAGYVYIVVGLLWAAVLFSVIRMWMSGRSSQIVRTLFVFVLATGAVLAIGNASQRAVNTTEAASQVPHFSEDDAAFATGTLPWVARTGVHALDSLTEVLVGGGTGFGFAETPNTTDPLDSPHCGEYIDKLETEFLRPDPNDPDKFKATHGVLLTVNRLWTSTFYENWLRANFGFTGGDGTSDIAARVGCRALEYKAGINPAVASQLARAAHVTDSPPTGFADLAVFSQTRDENIRRTVVAWAACAFDGQGGYEAASGWERFDDDGKHEPFEEKAHNDVECAAMLNGGLVGHSPEHDTFDLPSSEVRTSIDDAIRNNPNSFDDLRNIREFATAYNGANIAGRVVQGILAWLTAMVFFFTMAGLAIGLVATQFMLIVLLIFLPVTLILLGLGKPGGAKLAKLTGTVMAAKFLLTMLLVLIAELTSLGQTLILAATGSGGASLINQILFALMPVVALLIVNKMAKSMGMQSIMTPTGSLQFATSAALKATRDADLSARGNADRLLSGSASRFAQKSESMFRRHRHAQGGVDKVLRGIGRGGMVLGNQANKTYATSAALGTGAAAWGGHHWNKKRKDRKAEAKAEADAKAFAATRTPGTRTTGNAPTRTPSAADAETTDPAAIHSSAPVAALMPASTDAAYGWLDARADPAALPAAAPRSGSLTDPGGAFADASSDDAVLLAAAAHFMALDGTAANTSPHHAAAQAALKDPAVAAATAVLAARNGELPELHPPDVHAAFVPGSDPAAQARRMLAARIGFADSAEARSEVAALEMMTTLDVATSRQFAAPVGMLTFAEQQHAAALFAESAGVGQSQVLVTPTGMLLRPLDRQTVSRRGVEVDVPVGTRQLSVDAAANPSLWLPADVSRRLDNETDIEFSHRLTAVLRARGGLNDDGTFNDRFRMVGLDSSKPKDREVIVDFLADPSSNPTLSAQMVLPQTDPVTERALIRASKSTAATAALMDQVVFSEQFGQTSDAVEVLVEVTDRHAAAVTGEAGRVQGLLNEFAACSGKLRSGSLDDERTEKLAAKARLLRDDVDSALREMAASSQLGTEAAAALQIGSGVNPGTGPGSAARELTRAAEQLEHHSALLHSNDHGVSKAAAEELAALVGRLRGLTDRETDAARNAAAVLQDRLDTSTRQMQQNTARTAGRPEVVSGTDLRRRHGSDAAFV